MTRFGGGVVELITGIVLSLIGAGLGLSAGKALTEREYSMFRRPDSRGQAAVDPIAPGLLIVSIVAGIVILEFLAAWPAELRRASEEVVTPCYYFCGPWYTWLPVIFIGVVIVDFVGGYLYGEVRGDKHE
jgi:multisubunit Na+/H+ antiporter MnhC subunit